MSLTVTITQFAGGVNFEQTNPALRGMANYLLALCSPYSGQAQYQLWQSSGGGTVVPSGPVASRGDYRELTLMVQASDTAQYPSNGNSSFQNNNFIGATQVGFILYNNFPLQINSGFTFNSQTGNITLLNGNVFSYDANGSFVTIPYLSA